MQQSPNQSSGAPGCGLLGVLAAAGLAGAAAVALAAVAAHRVESPSLATASTVLMIHAAAVVALVAVAMRMAQPLAWTIVTGAMLASASLFCGAISYQAFMGAPIIKGAAPLGGTTLIVCWVAVALLGIREALRTR